MINPEPPSGQGIARLSTAEGGPNRLFRAGVAALVLSVVYYAIFAQVRSQIHLLLGLGMLALSMVPALRWTLRRHTPIPIFAIFTLTTLNTYALPLLNGHQTLLRYSVDTVTRTAIAVILFQVVAMVVHAAFRTDPGQGPFFEREIVSDGSSPWLLSGLVLVTLYSLVSTFSTLIPAELASVLRAAVSGAGLICTFVCMRNWGRGVLTGTTKSIVLILLLAQVLCHFSSLVMVAGLSLICLALIGFVSGAHRIPYVIIGLLIPLLAILHNGKADMRNRYWQTGDSPPEAVLTLRTLPQFYVEWFDYGLSKKEAAQDAHHSELTARLLDRSSLFHMLCMVVHYTPAQQPYMGGDTYGDIPGQFVPRFLWPEKPRGHISTTKLSVYYGLQREEDTEKTTIGFGLLPEAYANFGMLGIAGIAVFIALLFKWVEARTASSPLLTPAGLLLIVFTAWSFQTEFPLSMWLSSLFQALLVVLGVPLLWRRLFG